MIDIDLIKGVASLKGDLPTILTELEFINREIYDILVDREYMEKDEAKEIVIEPVIRAINHVGDFSFMKLEED